MDIPSQFRAAKIVYYPFPTTFFFLICRFRQRYVNGGYAIRIDIWGVYDVTRFFSIDFYFFLSHFDEFKQLLKSTIFPIFAASHR